MLYFNGYYFQSMCVSATINVHIVNNCFELSGYVQQSAYLEAYMSSTTTDDCFLDFQGLTLHIKLACIFQRTV